MGARSLLADRLSTSQRIVLGEIKQQLVNVGGAIRSYPSAMLGLAILLAFVGMAVFAPALTVYDPSRTFVQSEGPSAVLAPPSVDHPMGTDHLGHDIFTLWVYGSRISLMVGFLSGLSVAVIGTTVGLVAGYYKGWTDLVLMRVVDILYAIPPTPLIIVIALFYGGSVWNIILAMVLVLWRDTARLIRSQTLSLAERPFVKAARAAGAGDLRIMYLHIAPNLLPLLFINLTLVMGYSIVLEAGISFLGLGAQQASSWGKMLELTFTTGAIRYAWWWVIPPGLSITLLVMSFFYLSRAIEEITNPELGRFEVGE